MTDVNKNKTILLVEDDEDDIFALKRTLKKAGVTAPVHALTDGLQAIEYLTATGDLAQPARHPSPLLVLLDLKLPYFDGFQVLESIRNQPKLINLPVVILSGSNESRDRQKALALGAYDFCVKPVTVEAITRLLASLRSPG